MSSSGYFADSYKDARDRFLRGAAQCKADVSSHLYPLKGPSNEDLYVDVARVGENKATRVLIIISGTHGVEGFCGSGCQTAWLENRGRHEDSRSAVYLIHALNPYGFAWHRRVNEDNVDLNRNFLDFSYSAPNNEKYKEIESLLNPRVLSDGMLGQLDPKLMEWFSSADKIRAFKEAVGKGL